MEGNPNGRAEIVFGLHRHVQIAHLPFSEKTVPGRNGEGIWKEFWEARASKSNAKPDFTAELILDLSTEEPESAKVGQSISRAVLQAEESGA